MNWRGFGMGWSLGRAGTGTNRKGDLQADYCDSVRMPVSSSPNIKKAQTVLDSVKHDIYSYQMCRVTDQLLGTAR